MSSSREPLIGARRAESPASAPGMSGAGRGPARELEEPVVDDEVEPSTDDDDIDPNEFDLMLSRSIQSGGSLLEAESVEHSMLRGPRRYSYSRASSVAGRGGVRGGSVAAHERTPLLAGSGGGTGIRGRSPALPSATTGAGVASGDSTNADPRLESGDTDQLAPEESDGPGKKSPFLGGVSTHRFWLIFGVVLGAQFIANFDGTIMASSHPAITSYFNSSNSASWLSTAFLLTSSAFQPLLGRLSDTVGRKPPYVATITIFLLATLWCALADSMTSLIIARAFCGLGAGGMMTMGSIIVSDLVPIE